MTPSEMVTLTRYVMGACPQQKIDEFTPDIWHDLIGDLDLADCRAAVVTITGRRQPFVAPAEIRAEVQRIRGDRIARSQIPAPPHELCDHTPDYLRALRQAVKIAADGHALPAPQVRAITGGGRSGARGPTSLAAALGDVRKALGPGRPPRPALGDDRQMARDQVAEMREARKGAGAEGDAS